MGAGGGAGGALLAYLLACPLVAGGQALWGSRPAGGCSGPLVVCSLVLSALPLCLWYVIFEYGSISRFKGVFSVVCVVCVACVACVAFVFVRG